MIRIEPYLFSKEQIITIENLKNAKYVCSTEYKNTPVEVFYGAEAHPVSGSRYFALYRTGQDNELMITNGAFVEDQTFDALESKSGEIIYSRNRYDFVSSSDSSVSIDGGRSYSRYLFDGERPKSVMLKVKDGIMQVSDG